MYHVLLQIILILPPLSAKNNGIVLDIVQYLPIPANTVSNLGPFNVSIMVRVTLFVLLLNGLGHGVICVIFYNYTVTELSGNNAMQLQLLGK